MNIGPSSRIKCPDGANQVNRLRNDVVADASVDLADGHNRGGEGSVELS